MLAWYCQRCLKQHMASVPHLASELRKCDSCDRESDCEMVTTDIIKRVHSGEFIPIGSNLEQLINLLKSLDIYYTMQDNRLKMQVKNQTYDRSVSIDQGISHQKGEVKFYFNAEGALIGYGAWQNLIGAE